MSKLTSELRSAAASIDRRGLLRGAAALAAGGFAPGAWSAAIAADDYPTRPIRVVVSYTAGSGADILARYFTQALSKSLNAPVVVENKPGAGGNIGAANVAASPPDGYSLLLTPSSPVTGNPILYKSLPFATEDFTPVAPLLEVPFALAVPTASKVGSVEELTKLVKEKGGAAKYGAPTSASIAISAFYLDEVGAAATRVPYRAAQEALRDVESGDLDFLFIDLTGVIAGLKRGKVRVLAVTTDERSKSYPDIPTLKERNIHTAQWSAPFMVVGPKGMPPAVVKKLEGAFREIVVTKETEEFLRATGGEPLPGTSEFLAAFIQDQKKKWIRALDVAKLERI
ncbi:MAG TPA: tripartite tricarboxylate transporter substrate binding protein [Beijerinckiaceae bacterium]|jgi:tripartite-type tricarboxylate transporter receptor subunit TctC